MVGDGNTAETSFRATVDPAAVAYSASDGYSLQILWLVSRLKPWLKAIGGLRWLKQIRAGINMANNANAMRRPIIHKRRTITN